MPALSHFSTAIKTAPFCHSFSYSPQASSFSSRRVSDPSFLCLVPMEEAVVRPATLAAETAAGEGVSGEKKLTRTVSSDSDEMYSGTSAKGGKAIAASGGDVADAEVLIIPHVMDKTLILDRKTESPTTASIQDVGGYLKQPLQDQQPPEIYLRNLYNLPESHNFYCPDCRSCISKVIILCDTPDLKLSTPLHSGGGAPHQPPTYIPSKPQPQPQKQKQPPPSTGQSSGQNPETTPGEKGGSRTILCSNCFSFLTPVGTWISNQLALGVKSPAISAETGGASPSGTGTKPDVGTSHAGPSGTSYEPPTGGYGSVTIAIPPGNDETAGPTAGGGRKLEIVKSIVYGGLTEAITSLGIVASAASAKTPTENIVALALANLVTGLMVIVNNLSGLKSNQVIKKEPNETEEEGAKVDPYEETLGDRQHYLIHFTLAVLSFLLFGLLPPLVYGFSFRDTDDADRKLAAVAGSSLICISLLAVGKAYIQTRRRWQDFFTTVFFYISLGFGASGLSYLAGKEFDKLLEQLGWFKRKPTPPSLSLPGMGFENRPAWGSI